MKTDWRVWQEQGVVETFVAQQRPELLGSDVQLDTLLRLLRAAKITSGVVLDLGCGDGILLQTVLTAFPHVTGVALDGSPAMLAKAKERFQGEERVSFLEADFSHPDWLKALPVGQFAAVVSGFAIHHSEDEQKRALYADIFGLLGPGGVFVNIEHVASVSPFGEALSDQTIVEQFCRVRAARGEKVDFAAILAAHEIRPDKGANRLTQVETQLQWLRESGFVEVDCYWKHFELAVLAGYRPVS